VPAALAAAEFDAGNTDKAKGARAPTGHALSPRGWLCTRALSRAELLPPPARPRLGSGAGQGHGHPLPRLALRPRGPFLGPAPLGRHARTRACRAATGLSGQAAPDLTLGHRAAPRGPPDARCAGASLLAQGAPALMAWSARCAAGLENALDANPEYKVEASAAGRMPAAPAAKPRAKPASEPAAAAPATAAAPAAGVAPAAAGK
jgi:hypothetical protein